MLFRSMESDWQLPSEFMGLDFELPTIPAKEVSSLITLEPKPMDNIFVAACADEDMSIFSKIDHEEHLITGDIGDIMHDNTTLSMPNDDSLDNHIEDLSNLFSGDL